MIAYLDAGTGSVIVGAIVAGAAGVGVFFRMQFRKLKGRLSRKQHEDDSSDTRA